MNISENNPPWSFVHVSDIHVGSPRSYRFQPAWNENWRTARAQICSLAPDLLLVGGDLTRDGATHREELVAIKKDLEAMELEWRAIPGNHEVGNKWSADSSVAINSAYLRRYREVFGASEWSVVRGAGAHSVRFTGIDAFKLGSGLPAEADLRTWLEDQPAAARCPHHVWLIHPALFADAMDEEDFDPQVDRVAWYFALNRADRHYLWDIMRATGVTHVISGHIHCRRHLNVDGVEIHLAPATAFPQWGDRWRDGDDGLGFLRFSVADGRIRSEFIPLMRRSELRGYGPGGNPPVAGRDYTLATQAPFVPATD